MRARTAVVTVLIIALAYAGGSRTHAFSMSAVARSSPTQSSRTVASARATGAISGAMPLVSTLDVSVLDDEVRFVLRVQNVSDHKLELTFPDGQTHEITVVDAVGGEVWRWGAGQMFTQALRNQPLDPHASVSYAVRWRKPVAHGPLTAVGSLTSVNYPVETKAGFTLP